MNPDSKARSLKSNYPYMGARVHASDLTDSRRVSKLELLALQDLSTNRSLGNIFEIINLPRRISREKTWKQTGITRAKGDVIQDD